MLSYLETAIGFVVIMLGISLMIMILTQAISAALSYRGSTLMWGLAALFKNIDPKLKSLTANADALAKAVLTHSLVSDSVLTDIGGGWIVELLRKVTGMFDSLLEKFRLASAIRPDELVAILTHLANNPSLLPSQDAQLVADIKELLASQNPLIQRQVDFVRGAIGLAEAALANATPVIQDAVDAVGKVGGKLESWFNATMDRVSQRFSMHVRICTIVLAFLSAVVLQLDAVELVRNLFTNSDARAAFAGIADNMSSIAQNLLPGGGTADQVQTSMTKIFTDAVNNAETANNVQDATATGIASRADGESWITSHVADAQKQPAVLKSYNSAVDGALNQFLQNSGKSLTQIRDLLQKSGFEFPFHAWTDFGGSLKNVIKHFWGIFLAGALLSLGAPFWFNALKTLMNLRPVVAQKQKQEEQAQTA